MALLNQMQQNTTVTIKDVILSFPEPIKKALIPVHFNAGDIIVKKGQLVDYGFFFIDGAANILEEDYRGRNYLVNDDSRTTTCCLMDIYSSHYVQCCTVQATTDCIGYKLKKDLCWKLLRCETLFHEFLIVHWAQMFYLSTNNVYRYPIYETKHKLINFLLEYPIKTNNDTATIHIRRDLLASRLGCSKRTLYRILKELKESGEITIKETRIIIDSKQRQLLEKRKNSFTDI